jgi:hypothetical protein
MNKLKLLLTAILGFAAQYAFSQNILQAELLGRPTDKGISIQMFFDAGVEMSVKYGLQKGVYSGQSPWQSFAKGDAAEVVLTGLMQDTTYYYRVQYRTSGSGSVTERPEFKFHTARPKGKSFTFVIQADPHLDEQSDTNVYNRCLKNQLEDNPDFMIDLGDILMSDKLRTPAKVIPRDTVTYRAKMMRRYYEKMGHSVPIFITIGNHEGECGWLNNGTASNVAVWGTVDRKKYFMNPEPGTFYTGDTTQYPFVGRRNSYYAWQWGDALFMVIDPYWNTKPKPDSLNGWRWTLGRTQYEWLKTTLEQSDAKFKFLFSHQLVGGDPEGRGGVEFCDLYEWGGNNLNGTYGFTANRPGWYKPIRDILRENKVTVFFHGHDHFFGKQERNCLIYQETPQPSHPNYSAVNYADDYGYFEGQILPNSGHLRVSVSPTATKVDYVRAYLPQVETANRKNKDVSATYTLAVNQCYDTLTAAVPVIWNANYKDELMYPNPFDARVFVPFTANGSEVVDISVMDMQGRLIKSLLVNQQPPAGKHFVIWDGTGNAGQSQPAGMYRCTIRINGKIQTSQTLILNKP